MSRASVSPDPPVPPADAVDAVAPAAPVPVELPVARPEACANCGAALAGEFCHRCGQRRIAPDDLAAGRSVRRLAEELTDLDGKVFRTLRALVVRPGHLTAEYLAGRREAYLSPVKLFIVVTAVFFLVGWDAFLEMQDVRAQLASFPAYAADASDEGPRAAALFEVWVDRAGDLLGWLRLANLFVVAGVLHLVFFRRRSLFGEHLTFALHYYAFDLALVLGLVGLFWGPAIAGPVTVPPAGLLALEVAALAAYLWLALRRVYGLGRARTTLLTGALLLLDLQLAGLASDLAVRASHALTYGG